MDAGIVVGPAIEIASTAALKGWRKIARYLSPTVLIAGQNSSGKTTLRDYFVTGYLPDKPIPMDETMRFESELIDMTYKGSDLQGERRFSFWVRDSRGFFDAGPLAQDIDAKHPRFIYIFFDVRRIKDPKDRKDDIDAT
jgi:hypothetical protein